MSDSKNEYRAGSCNIGAAEKKTRLRAGWIGAALTVVVWLLFILLRVPAPWRIILLLPGMLAASGFLQASFGFCVNFGMRGVQNFGDVVGKVTVIEVPEDRLKDRARSLRIIAYSAAIAILVAAAGFLSGLAA